jgi:hypothetical protein
MTKFSRTSTGKYSVSGKTFDVLIGTRAQVWHGTAYKTTGGLSKPDLMQNKAGRIVSKAKHMSAKREKRLVKAGFLTKKGQFGFVKNGKSMKKARKGSRKMRGGVGNAVGLGHLGVAQDAALVAAGGSRRRRSRKMRGGMAYGGNLSPMAYDGKGEGLTGNSVGVQFAAGMGN